MFLKNKKLAIITISEDPFIAGTCVMLHSLFNNGKITNFNFSSIDIIILNNKNNLGYPLILSDDNIVLLNTILSEFNKNSIKINQISELNLVYYDKIKKMRRKDEILNNSIYTFEIFSDYYLNNYDYILYCDSDILFINEIEKIKKHINWDILACYNASQKKLLNNIEIQNTRIAKYNYTPYASNNNKPIGVNGGFFIINTKKIAKNSLSFLQLLHINKEINNTEELADQGTINEYFEKYLPIKLYVLPYYTMAVKRGFEDSLSQIQILKETLAQSTMLHYVGSKPWHKNKIGRENNYKNIEKIWIDYKNKIMKN